LSPATTNDAADDESAELADIKHRAPRLKIFNYFAPILFRLAFLLAAGTSS